MVLPFNRNNHNVNVGRQVKDSYIKTITKEAWESELQKLERLPDPKIFDLLKLSYDTLDDEQKDIFLDIACFYRGHLENAVEELLDSCGFSARIGIEVLKDRCLISILEGRIVMHGLIQQMGHQIVGQQCVNDPGKRSRLWKPEEIYHVLTKNKGNDAIHCIFLDICKIKEVRLHPETFNAMHNLRMMNFYTPNSGRGRDSNVLLPAFLQSLPDELKFCRWDGFPQKTFPLNFCPENLVKLDMPCSHLEQLWEGDQDLPNLKCLNLSGSNKLLQVPDLSHSPNIEEIFLSHCVRLVQVYSSSFLSKLNCLCLDGCYELKSVTLPSNILSRSSGLVVLYDFCKLETCSFGSTREKDEDKVVQFPPNSGYSRFDRFHKTTECLTCNADGYRIGEYYSQSLDPIPSADSHDPKPRDEIHLLNIKDILNTSIMPSISTTLNELCWLDFSNCRSLTSLPTQIFKLKLLRRLYLGGCCNLEELPEIEEPLENLTVLILNKTSIKELPSSLHLLVGLEELSLYDCQNLEIIPSSIGSLTKLCKLRLTCCESLKTFPSSIFKLKQLKGLDFHGCSMLRTFPEILEPAENFAHINLTKTTIKELPSSLEYLVGLQTLRLNLCTQLVSLQNNIAPLDLLSKIDCSGCTSLKEIPNNVGRLSLLRELSLQESSIVNLPESIAHLTSLKTLDISDCKSLQCIPQLPPFLDQLAAFDCPSIRRVLLLPQNSISRVPDDNSEEGTSTTFRFYFTNSTQGLDCSSSIGAEAWFRIKQYAYRSVIFCFPGHGIPDWFPYRCKGHENRLPQQYEEAYWLRSVRRFGSTPTSHSTHKFG